MRSRFSFYLNVWNLVNGIYPVPFFRITSKSKSVV